MRIMTRAANTDAFGHGLFDRHRGQQIHSVIERDDGYIDVGDLSEYFAKPVNWPPRLQQAIPLAGRHADGCSPGIGRRALAAKRGQNALGQRYNEAAMKRKS